MHVAVERTLLITLLSMVVGNQSALGCVAGRVHQEHENAAGHNVVPMARLGHVRDDIWASAGALVVRGSQA